MTFLALLAAAVGTFYAGLLVGRYANRPYRVPDHPTLRRAPQRPRLHVIYGDPDAVDESLITYIEKGNSPYDQDRERAE